MKIVSQFFNTVSALKKTAELTDSVVVEQGAIYFIHRNILMSLTIPSYNTELSSDKVYGVSFSLLPAGIEYVALDNGSLHYSKSKNKVKLPLVEIDIKPKLPSHAKSMLESECDVYFRVDNTLQFANITAKKQFNTPFVFDFDLHSYYIGFPISNQFVAFDFYLIGHVLDADCTVECAFPDNRQFGLFKITDRDFTLKAFIPPMRIQR